MKKFTICCTFLSILLLTAFYVCNVYGQQPDRTRPYPPGEVNYLPLSEFASPELQNACSQLLQRQYDTAAPQFRSALAQNKNDLVAFLGLIQADPNMWPQEISRLKSEAGRSPETAESDFKLGAVSFYQAWTQLNTGDRQQGTPGLAQATALLKGAWQKSKQPVIGALYAQASEMYSPALAYEATIYDQMIKELAGPKAYASYLKAQRSGWRAEPPPISEVPPARLKPLRGAVRLARSLAGARVGYGSIQGNHVKTIYDPIPPLRQRKFEYLTKWRDMLDKTVQQDK